MATSKSCSARGRIRSKWKANWARRRQNKKLAFQSFGAHFCEVKIDPLLPRVQVTRVVSVINWRPDRERENGAQPDHWRRRHGRRDGVDGRDCLRRRDRPAGDAQPGRLPCADERRYPADRCDVCRANRISLSIRSARAGMGEIGITGIAAAIANAVYHATGKRVRDLPITPDKLI